ncbi:glutamic acid-rich protein-like, partial [Oscarella lobularis]|uniref:glutamic acid-rich protein-like n=1 Tax=Oscarella lobularis TaxID=121494 RepID=UPI003314123F
MVFARRFVAAALLVILSGFSQTRHTKLCRDPLCQEPISIASARRAHRSADGRLLSFNSRDRVKVFAKHEGENKLIWEGEIDGKRGYFPAVMVEEIEILSTDLQRVPATGVLGGGSPTTVGDSANQLSEPASDVPASVDQWRKEQEKPVEGMDLPEGSSAREIMIEKEETTGDDGGHDNDKEQDSEAAGAPEEIAVQPESVEAPSSVSQELRNAQQQLEELKEKKSVIAMADEIGVPLSPNMDRNDIEKQFVEAQKRVEELLARRTKEEAMEKNDEMGPENAQNGMEKKQSEEIIEEEAIKSREQKEPDSERDGDREDKKVSKDEEETDESVAEAEEIDSESGLQTNEDEEEGEGEQEDEDEDEEEEENGDDELNDEEAFIPSEDGEDSDGEEAESLSSNDEREADDKVISRNNQASNEDE